MPKGPLWSASKILKKSVLMSSNHPISIICRQTLKFSSVKVWISLLWPMTTISLKSTSAVDDRSFPFQKISVLCILSSRKSPKSERQTHWLSSREKGLCTWAQRPVDWCRWTGGMLIMKQERIWGILCTSHLRSGLCQVRTKKISWLWRCWL